MTRARGLALVLALFSTGTSACGGTVVFDEAGAGDGDGDGSDDGGKRELPSGPQPSYVLEHDQRVTLYLASFPLGCGETVEYPVAIDCVDDRSHLACDIPLSRLVPGTLVGADEVDMECQGTSQHYDHVTRDCVLGFTTTESIVLELIEVDDDYVVARVEDQTGVIQFPGEVVMPRCGTGAD